MMSLVAIRQKNFIYLILKFKPPKTEFPSFYPIYVL